MRVVSLLPAATEIVAALGALDALVGVSHDCDYPPEVRTLPRVSRSLLHPDEGSGRSVDRAVRDALAQHGTLYRMDEPLLRQLAPEVILSQRLCDVCAPAYGSVAALAADLPGSPQVLNLEPARLEEVFGNARTVAWALGRDADGEALVADLQRRVEAVCRATREAPSSPRCLVLEWLEPPFRSGHWVPELVALAGGWEPLGRAGERSVPVAWEQVVAAAPEVLVIAACGQTIEATLADIERLHGLPAWRELPAVQRGEVYALDGSAYLSRPGPRLVDALEIVAGILHPRRFPAWQPESRPSGVVKVAGAGRRYDTT